MEINMSFILFLCVYSTFASATVNIAKRQVQTDDTIRNERELIQEMNEEVNSIKKLLQDGQADTFIPHNFLSHLDEEVTKLFKGFVEEKKQNKELKEEITRIKRNVQELHRTTDEISASLTECVKNIESMKDQVEQSNSEIAKKYTHVQKDIQKINENIEEVQISLISDAESLTNVTNEMLEIKEKVEHEQHIQGQSILNISINNHLVSSLKEQLSTCGCSSINETEDTIKYNSRVSSSTVAASTAATSPVATSVVAASTAASLPVATSTSTPTQMTTYTETPETMRKSCLDLFYNERKTFHVDGMYNITSGKAGPISVYCDMTTDGGGWTVFQRRQDGYVDFYRDWNDYKTGFGNLTGEFWLGNEYLHLLTDNNEPHELRIELEDHDGNRAFAKYHNFKIGSESTNYRLQLNGYNGIAGDSLEKSLRGQSYQHDGMEFSTFDRDNDKSNGSCAVDFKGAWWYNSCFESNLNSLYHDQPLCNKPWVGIVWNTWKGSWYSLKSTEMKFR